jgi:hypothetical protein
MLANPTPALLDLLVRPISARLLPIAGMPRPASSMVSTTFRPSLAFLRASRIRAVGLWE